MPIRLPVRSLLVVLIVLTAPARADDPDPRLLDRLEALDADGLELASVNAVVAELSTGIHLYSKNAERAVPIASITKLMTAMVVLDSGEPLDEWLAVVERRRPAPNNAWSRIRLNSRARRRQLIKIALIASDNRAAHVLARHHPGGLDAFVEAMNAKAAALGMNRTRFVGPSGLSPGNYSTPADLLRLAQAAIDYDLIRKATRTPVYVADFRKPYYRLVYANTNLLVHRNRWDVQLSKTGFLNEAGRCLLMLTRIDGMDIAMVLLDSFGRRTPIGDAGRIRRWLLTGDGGPIARAALAYERRKTSQFAQAAAETP